MAAFTVPQLAALLLLLALADERCRLAEAANKTCSGIGSIFDCAKLGLTYVPQRIPNWVETLRLDSNSIQIIQAGAFVGLTKLKELILSKNKITDLNGEMLCSELPELHVLTLSKNRMSRVPSLSGCQKLDELHMRNNNVTNLRAESLRDLSALQHLDIRRNRLVELSSGVFPRNLKTLILSENRLVRLSNSTFETMVDLRKLSLAKNKLAVLPARLFFGFAKLHELDLSANKLQTIAHTTFKDLAELRNLSLKQNRLETLEPGSFLGCKQLEYLDLSGNMLFDLKPGCFFGLEKIGEILLASNRISSIHEQVWQHVSTATKVDLSQNSLSRISAATFGSLKRLQTLLLARNSLQYIEDDALHNLVDLEWLDLSGNRLSDALLSSSSSVFGRLSVLKVLDLRNNSVNSLSHKLFRGLSALQRLFLDGNPITTIELNAFGELSSLAVLQINSEKLVCDCKLAWLPAWLKEASFVSSVTGTCQEPSRLRGRGLQLVLASDLTCDADNRYTVPSIVYSPPPVTNALRGSSAVLVCQAMSLSHSRIIGSFWMRNTEEVHSSDNVLVEILVSATDDAQSNFTVSLRIKNVTDDDEGRYQCGFTNEYGASYSHKVDLKVLVFPQFTVLPANVKAKADQDVSIRCAATGQPPPEISIQKDVGDSFPSARDRRFSFNPDTNEFIIRKVRAEDAGVYHCVAKNEAGTSVANATVEVLEPPHFIGVLECPPARRGRPTVLECLVEGTPQPNITWQHDGIPLSASEQRVFALNRLILPDPGPSDAGLYSCLASNILGKVQSSCTLTIAADDGGGSAVAAPSGGGSSLPGERGGTSGVGASSAPWLDSTITGVIVISVVACVVGTSLIWVVIIYHTHKKKHHCLGSGRSGAGVRGSGDSSSSHTDDTLVPLPLSCAGSGSTNASSGDDGYGTTVAASSADWHLLPPKGLAAGLNSEHMPTARWCLAVSRTNEEGHNRDGVGGASLLADAIDVAKKGQTLPFARGRSRWQQAQLQHHMPQPSDWDYRSDYRDCYAAYDDALATRDSLLSTGYNAEPPPPPDYGVGDDVFDGGLPAAGAHYPHDDGEDAASATRWRCSFRTFQQLPAVASAAAGSVQSPTDGRGRRPCVVLTAGSGRNSRLMST